MGKRLKNILASLLCLTGCVGAQKSEPTPLRWAAYYDKNIPAERFENLDLVIFDLEHHPDFSPIKDKTTLLAYISLGEVHGHLPEKDMLKKADALLYKNKNWDSYAVDLASPLWRKMVLTRVSDALGKGFDGVMLDTVDSPLHWAGQQSPKRQEAMQREAVELIRAMRAAHPDMKIMLNRGFEILPEISPELDYVLAESILTQKDDLSGQFKLFEANTYADAVAQLHRSVSSTEHLKIFTLDYWDVDDVDGLAKIYALQRASGFMPYVTSQDLRRYTPEPPSYVQISRNSHDSGR